jgi:hypothetical protein
MKPSYKNSDYFIAKIEVKFNRGIFYKITSMKTDKSVWIFFGKESILMTHDSKAFLYAKFPDGNKNLTLKDSDGKILDELKLKDLYNKEK